MSYLLNHVILITIYCIYIKCYKLILYAVFIENIQRKKDKDLKH